MPSGGDGSQRHKRQGSKKKSRSWRPSRAGSGLMTKALRPPNNVIWNLPLIVCRRYLSS